MLWLSKVAYDLVEEEGLPRMKVSWIGYSNYHENLMTPLLTQRRESGLLQVISELELEDIVDFVRRTN